MSFVSVTRLRLRSPLYLLPFLRYAFASHRQAMQAPGNLATALRRAPHLAFWTLTVWDNEASMRHYMTTGAHRQAMPKLARWCDEASAAHWHQDGDELPSWNDAEQFMLAKGRLYLVSHPSSTHLAGEITR